MITNRQFILSVPSWVIPGTYAENLRFLENKKDIDGVELLFFMYDDEIKKQLDSEWDEIVSFSGRFVFTAHLPERLLPVHNELIKKLAPIVRHFIVHPDINNISAQVKLLSDFSETFQIPFLTENTNPGYLDKLLPFLDKNNGMCMDTGHLLLDGKDPANYFSEYGNRIKEIHLHGMNREKAVIDGRLADHRSLRGNEPWLAELFLLLKNYSGVINLEMFSWDEIAASIPCINGNSFF